MKRIFLLLIAVCSTATLAFSQQRDEEAPRNGFKKENLFFGGNLGLTFGSYTFINVSPQVGYHISKYVDLGLGPNFQYISLKSYDGFGNDYSKESRSVLGANIFTRLYPIRQAFVQIQPEYNWINAKLKYYNVSGYDSRFKTSAPSLLLGVGANLNGLLISVMYDVAQDPNSPYNNRPFINFGYVF